MIKINKIEIKNGNAKIVHDIYEIMLSAKKITIFAHDNQDNDAYGSSLGMCYFLRSLNIDARIADVDRISSKVVTPFVDHSLPVPDDAFIKGSVGVLLDLGNSNIASSSSYKLCSRLVRIDHHLWCENFADIEWVDHNYSSTSEMVGWLILFNCPGKMSKQVADALYVGILADTGSFMYDTTQSSTFELITIFYQCGFDKVKLQDKMLLHDWKEVLNDRNLANEVQVTSDGIGYLVITDELKLKYGIRDEEGKIFIMNGIKDFKVWFSVYYKPEKKVYKVSIRSREYNVQQVALLYNGGGHRLASGFCLTSLNDIPELINNIKSLLMKKS